MRLIVTAILFLAAVPPLARSAPVIPRHVFGSGAIGSSSAGHAVRSTLGQPVVGLFSGSRHRILAGFWIPTQGGTSDVGSHSSLPRDFALAEGAPNPFGPSTMLHYSVGNSGGPVRIRIFDAGGRLVRTLIDRVESPGPGHVAWDGRDTRGHRVPAGLYLASMDAPGFSASRKLVLGR